MVVTLTVVTAASVTWTVAPGVGDRLHRRRQVGLVACAQRAAAAVGDDGDVTGVGADGAGRYAIPCGDAQRVDGAAVLQHVGAEMVATTRLFVTRARRLRARAV